MRFTEMEKLIGQTRRDYYTVHIILFKNGNTYRTSYLQISTKMLNCSILLKKTELDKILLAYKQ